MAGRERLRFRGRIAGVGSTSGIRVVVGRWHESPFGSFADAMVALPDGHRLLLAPSEQVAEFVAATYTFDEVRIEPSFRVDGDPDGHWQVRSDSLSLDLWVGRRTWLGWLLVLVPRRVAEAPWWCTLTDLVARFVVPGVRTKGDTGDRLEWYGATDNRVVSAARGGFDDVNLGALARVAPAPMFGFSSTPAWPSVTRVVTTVEPRG